MAAKGEGSGLNERARALAERIVRELRAAGHVAVLAGGCVRDLQLGRTPDDWDVATSASPAEVRRLFRRTVPVGVQFGVVLVVDDGAQVEVATFRREGPYPDHRHPATVASADPREDAGRRDFTINGMFLDPESGEVIDYVGGLADLRAGLIRAIGDPRARFDEDRLRLLRAIRFAARFGYRIEERTWEALCELAPGIAAIAWERIGDEIDRILREGAARRGFELLAASGLLAAVLPEVEAMRGVAQPPEFHPEGDVFVHTLCCLEQLSGDRHGEALRFAVLLHDVAKPVCAKRSPEGRIQFHGHAERGAEMTREICRRLRRSREVGEAAAWLVANHLRYREAREMRVARLRRLLAEPAIDDLLELVRIDLSSGGRDLSLWRFCRERLAELGERERRPEPLLRGRDLIALGYRPGPAIGEILQRAYDAQLEGELRSAEEARAWALAHFPPEDGAPAA